MKRTGEPAKASAAKVWVIALMSILIALPVAVTLLPGLGNLSTPLGIVLLVSWYSGSARQQVHYVKQRFGQNYPRRGWGKPLLLAVAALVAYFIFLVIVGFALAAIGAVNAP